MPLKNHQDAIPGGFQFYQPETNWSLPPWCEWDMGKALIIKHRLANPRHNLSTNPGVVDAEYDFFNDRRLRSMPGTEHFLTGPPPAGGAPPNFPKPQRLARSVAAVKRYGVGIGVVVEMFGDAMEPVAPEVAEQRAAICVKCPKNIRGNLLQRFTQEVVKGLQLTLSIVKEMELTTSVDAQLGTCSACECPLPFKVQVPMDHVLKNTTAETMAKFDRKCWIVAAKDSLQNPAS